MRCFVAVELTDRVSGTEPQLGSSCRVRFGLNAKENVNDLNHAVFVVDDDESVRASIAHMLRSNGLSVVCFRTATEFLSRANLDTVACLLLDLRLPDMSGLEVQQELASRGVQIPTVIVTAHADIQSSVLAMKAGAVDFLTKPFVTRELLAAVHEALRRGKEIREARTEVAEINQRFAVLTRREREVVMLVLGGLSNKQIASELGISEVTVKIHRKQIMNKTRATSLAELVRIAERVAFRLK